MGCCEVREPIPVGWPRFVFGLMLLASAHAFFYLVVGFRSVAEPRYRPVRRFYGRFILETLRDAAHRREVVLTTGCIPRPGPEQ